MNVGELIDQLEQLADGDQADRWLVMAFAPELGGYVEAQIEVSGQNTHRPCVLIKAAM